MIHEYTLTLCPFMIKILELNDHTFNTPYFFSYILPIFSEIIFSIEIKIYDTAIFIPYS